MDDERLKNGGSVLTVEYFDHLLEQIREIRLSERRFYQKITDIYATALDYDRTAKTTKQFFAKVQNKMHYAVHGHTAAELIYERADADKPHMGLTTWYCICLSGFGRGSCRTSYPNDNGGLGKAFGFIPDGR